MAPTVLAFAALPAAFAIAELTGVRAIGGVLLFALAAAAVLTSRASLGRKLLWVLVLGLCFGASHALADPLTTVGAIALVTLVTGAAGQVLLHQAQP